MRKWWKLVICGLGLFVGLFAALFLVACWLLFTPERLTAIVNDLSNRYLKCEASFEEVDLSLFSTFPYAGLKVSNVAVINPVDNAASDTVAFVSELLVGVDVKSFVSSGDVVVKEVVMKRSDLCLYTDSNGISNYSVFVSDSLESDTSAFVLPNLIDVEKLKFEDMTISYCDASAGVRALVDNLSISVKGCLADSSLNAKCSVVGDSLYMNFSDSLRNVVSNISLADFRLSTDLNGSLSRIAGNVDMCLPYVFVDYGGVVYTTSAMLESDVDMLKIDVPFVFDLDNRSVSLSESQVSVLSYGIDLSGDVVFPHDSVPLNMNVSFQTNKWRVEPLLSILPDQLTSAFDGMDMDASLRMSGNVVGELDSACFPNVEANVMLSDGRFYSPAILPYKVSLIDADFDVLVNGIDAANAVVNHLDLTIGDSKLNLKGSVNDVLGAMMANVYLSGNVPLPLVQYWVPDTVPIHLDGDAMLSLNLNASLNDVLRGSFSEMKVKGAFDVSGFDVSYDTLRVQSPLLSLVLNMPSDMNQSDIQALFSARLKSNYLNCYSSGNSLNAQLMSPDLELAVNDIFDSANQLAICCDLDVLKTETLFDSLTVSTGPCSVVASMAIDSMRDNPVSRLTPKAAVALKGVRAYVPQLNETVKMSTLELHYDSNLCLIEKADMSLGNSDYHFSGNVVNLESWLSHKDILKGDLYFTSNFANVDQMIDMVSGLGSDKDSLAVMLAEDHVDEVECPFIVPEDVDFTLHTHINTTYAFGNRISDVNGDIRICDGVVVLDEVGFVCEAARMQLTAIYKSPRPNHLFLGADFHLLDIDINSLIHLVPYIDTLVPMLSAFEGKGDFHLATEMYMDHAYRPKQSTMRGAAAITGHDLVVMDNDVVKNMAQLLRLQDWRDTDGKLRIDSLDVEATLFQNEIEIYPFRLDLHKYGMVLSGRHTVENKCNYHVELVKCPLPVRLAVDVNGDIAQPKIELGKVQYAEFYNPAKQNAAQQQMLLIKQMIKQSLEGNVKMK